MMHKPAIPEYEAYFRLISLQQNQELRFPLDRLGAEIICWIAVATSSPLNVNWAGAPMEQWLALAIMVALANLILQVIKVAFDLYDRALARKLARRQYDIALFVALVEIVDSLNLAPGEALAVKRQLVRSFLADALPAEILAVLKRNPSGTVIDAFGGTNPLFN
jgi:hypothetical protein